MQATLRRHDADLLSTIHGTLRAGIAIGEFRTDLDVNRDAQLVRRMLDAVGELALTDPEALHPTVAATTRTLLASVAASGAGLSSA